MKRNLILFFSIFTLIIGICGKLNAQNYQLLSEIKDSLIAQSERVYTLQDDESKMKLNAEISKNVLKAIKQEKSIDYSFDSIKYISVLTSEDKMIRIFSWVLPKDEGGFECYGFVQSYDDNLKMYRQWELKDVSATMQKPETKIMSSDKWFGAVYYYIITTKSGGKKYYTLLGWNPTDRFSRKKVIEIVTLKRNGEPVFGYSLFNAKELKYVKETNAKRIIFEYSAQTRMHLNYETQIVREVIPAKKEKSKKPSANGGFASQKKEVRPEPEIKTFSSKLIIFDRLAPKTKDVEGIYQFYFPESNVMDGLVFKDGKWKFYTDIDARNPIKIESTPKKPINYNLY